MFASRTVIFASPINFFTAAPVAARSCSRSDRPFGGVPVTPAATRVNLSPWGSSSTALIDFNPISRPNMRILKNPKFEYQNPK